MEANLEQLTELQQKIILAFRDKEIGGIFKKLTLHQLARNVEMDDKIVHVINALYKLQQVGIVELIAYGTDCETNLWRTDIRLTDNSFLMHLEKLQKPVLSLDMLAAIIAQLSVNITGVKPDISAVFYQVSKAQDFDQVKGLEYVKCLLRTYFNTKDIENAE